MERPGDHREEGDQQKVGHLPGENAAQDEIRPHQQPPQGQPDEREEGHGAAEVPLLAADGERERDDGEKLEGYQIEPHIRL